MIEKLKAEWSEKGFYDKFLVIASAVFLLVVIFSIILRGVFFTPDQFFAVGLVFALVIGQAQAFLWDWTPLILLILSYEYLRGLIPKVNHHIHFALMADFDKLIFGQVPSAALQRLFFSADHIHWYDYTAVVFYSSHFVVPMVVAYAFWLRDRTYFREYAIAILSLSYLTFMTYLIFPAAPPWMASQFGVIPHTQELTALIISHLFPSVSLPTLYHYFGANLTAAVPSLHAAFPLLTSIYIYKKYPKLLPILILYTLGLWLSVIYLGEHYVFDVLLGAVYALVIYAFIQRAKAYFHSSFRPAVPEKIH